MEGNTDSAVPVSHEQEEVELSAAQLERIDEIHNAVFELCVVLTENDDLEWDMAYIGEIADVACDILVSKGLRVRYPAIVSEEDGVEKVIDYHSEC